MLSLENFPNFIPNFVPNFLQLKISKRSVSRKSGLQANAGHNMALFFNLFGWIFMLPAKLRPGPLGTYPSLGYVMGHELGHTMHRELFCVFVCFV